MKKPQTIEEKREYNLTEMSRSGMIPEFGTNVKKYRAAVKEDRKLKNILQATVIGKNKMGTRYYIKGKNILRFRKAIEDGYRNILQV